MGAKPRKLLCFGVKVKKRSGTLTMFFVKVVKHVFFFCQIKFFRKIDEDNFFWKKTFRWIRLLFVLCNSFFLPKKIWWNRRNSVKKILKTQNFVPMEFVLTILILLVSFLTESTFYSWCKNEAAEKVRCFLCIQSQEKVFVREN